MKKILTLTLVVGVFLMISFVLAAEDLSEELDDFVRKVAEKKGINKSEITEITEVELNNLPKEINIKNIDDSNIGLYKVDSKIGGPSFIITFSEDAFQKISSPQAFYTTSLLHFGLKGKEGKSTFLETATGVSGSLDKGYVMLRSGSITGISTNFEAVKSKEDGTVQIIIYKNGEEIGFGNSIEVLSSGIKKDYDIQSIDIVTFKPGDIISVYARIQGKTSIQDIITVIETSSVMN